jgi:glycogen synthase
MRVLMTADTLGGIWTYAAELAEALAARRVDVTVAALGRRPTDDQLAAMPSASVVARECALEWMPDAWPDVEETGAWLLALRDELDPEVIHLNGYAHAALPWQAPVVVVAHSCVLSWFEAVRDSPAPLEWTRYRIEVERGLRAADAVVAPTAAMLAVLERHYSFAAERLVIPNGRRGPVPAPKRPFVLTAGRIWDEAKNVAALERIAPRLPWPVRTAGEGSAAGHVARCDLDRLLAEAAVFALPARYEPFGLAALEAGLAGCALILGDIPSLREVWAAAALFVDPDDDLELELALRLVIGDSHLRARLAEAAQTRAARFTPERMAHAYLRLYGRLLAEEPTALEVA